MYQLSAIWGDAPLDSVATLAPFQPWCNLYMMVWLVNRCTWELRANNEDGNRIRESMFVSGHKCQVRFKKKKWLKDDDIAISCAYIIFNKSWHCGKTQSCPLYDWHSSLETKGDPCLYRSLHPLARTRSSKSQETFLSMKPPIISVTVLSLLFLVALPIYLMF